MNSDHKIIGNIKPTNDGRKQIQTIEIDYKGDLKRIIGSIKK